MPVNRAGRPSGGSASKTPAATGEPATGDDPSLQGDTPSPGPTESTGAPSPSTGAPRSRAQTLVRGTSWQLVAQVVPLAINLLLTPFVILGLGPARFSAFLLIATVANLLGQFDGGVGVTTLRYCTLYCGRDDRLSTTRLLTTTALVIAGLTLIGATAVVLLTSSILSFFGVAAVYIDEATVLLRTLSVLVGLILIRSVFHSVLAARHLFKWISITMLVGYAVYAGGLYMTARNGWDLRAIAAVMVTQQVTVSLLTIPRALPFLDRKGVRLMPAETAREFFAFAWKAQISGLVTIAVSQKDQLFAGRVLSAQLSGPYSQGYGLAFQIKSLPYNAIKPIQAALGEEYARHGAAAALPLAERLQRFWVRGVTGWAVIGVPASFVGVRAWLPDSFALTGLVVAVLLTGHCVVLLGLVLWLWVLTLGHPGIELRASLLGLVVNLGLSVALLGPFGMVGVISATALGQLAMMMTMIALSRRRLPTPIRSPLTEIPWVAAFAGALVCTGIELAAAGHLPRGVLGLACAGLLALPGAALFASIAFGGELRSLVRRRPQRARN